MSNSKDPDETAHYEQSLLDLRYFKCLLLSPKTVEELIPFFCNA